MRHHGVMPDRLRRFAVSQRALVALVAAAALAAGLTACGAAGGQGAAGGTVPPSAASSSVPGSSSEPPAGGAGTSGSGPSGASTTTSTTIPAGLPSSPKVSASALLDAWVAGDRKAADEVALPDAVAVLFADAYEGQPLVPRGCSRSGRSPVTCVYGPAGRIAPTSPTYRLVLRSHSGGWYVAAVVVVQPALSGSGVVGTTG
jgi:hypothetical protein